MSKIFSFSGRIGKSNFGLTCLIYLVFIGAFNTITATPIVENAHIHQVLALLYIPMTWMFLAQGAKRCHDIGRNGFYQIIPGYTVVLLITDGELYRNEYGPNPEFPEEEKPVEPDQALQDEESV